MWDLEKETERRTMKHFAEMEMNRRKSEENLRSYSAREKMQEAEEKVKVKRWWCCAGDKGGGRGLGHGLHSVVLRG